MTANKKLTKTCSICGRHINLTFYKDHSYRGGHYFGKVPLYSKLELNKSLKSGTHQTRIAGHVFNVLNRKLKPYQYMEYWECPKCY